MINYSNCTIPIPTVVFWYPFPGFQFGHVALQIRKLEHNFPICPYPYLSGDTVNFFAQQDNSAERIKTWNPFRSSDGVSTYIEQEMLRFKHKKYFLNPSCLNMNIMFNELANFSERNKRYNLLSFNCATAVAEIMKKSKVPHTPCHIVWTPSDIARWCDHLVMTGKAEKHKLESTRL